MGIFSDLSSEAYRGSKTMPGCKGPQQSHYLGEPQAPDSVGNCTSAGLSSGLHEGRCPQGLSTGTPHQGKQLVINTHKGRYRFKQMPFGAKMSQDVFQIKMDLIKEKCPGVISIHDDIVIYGTCEEDHDANCINLLNVAQLEGLF